MKQIGVTIFIMMVLAILSYLLYAIYDFKVRSYGRCWSLIKRTIDDLYTSVHDVRYRSHIRDQCKKDLDNLVSFVQSYNGNYDIDQVSPSFDPDHSFFIELKSLISINWHLKESHLKTVLESAIYAYNCDSEYHITPREFINYVAYQFESYFIKKL